MEKKDRITLPSLDILSFNDIKAGEKLFSRKISFRLGVKNKDHLPTSNLPEIAFAGRSNVGKSSLINNLTFQKKIARVSKKPGSTQQINFFEILDILSIVDLPGYGFAKTSKLDKANWGKLIETYLVNNSALNRVFLLIDCRRGISKVDLNFMDFLEKYAIVFEIIVTKIDKIDYQSSQVLISEIEKINSTFTTAFPRVILTSSNNYDGMDKLRAEISRMVI
ncbi:MAG: putative GTP-binding protein EngB [Alphaproteobacteria bacterium MarineAlpha2_Bin1]|nr:MAG: putative GTP-binding protein EngB [Alphaproteobacteria bacterium MarineAlpha2_Bin1]